MAEKGMGGKQNSPSSLLLPGTKKLSSLKKEKDLSVLTLDLFQQRLSKLRITTDSYSSVIIWQYLGELHRGDP